MWRKLWASGHVERTVIGKQETYARSALGQQEIERFDRYVSFMVEEVLIAIRADSSKRSRACTMRGIMAALESGLVGFDEETDRYRLSPDAEAILDRRFGIRAEPDVVEPAVAEAEVTDDHPAPAAAP
jgi:hypothetical protein